MLMIAEGVHVQFVELFLCYIFTDSICVVFLCTYKNPGIQPDKSLTEL